MDATLADDAPLTLDEACRLIFKNAIRPATLRAEAERGNLVIERIGRRDFVTQAAIREMRIKCQQVPSAKAPASGSSPNASAPAPRSAPSGSSATDGLSVARDAALLSAEKLSRISPATSPKNIARQSATVIPLRS